MLLVGTYLNVKLNWIQNKLDPCWMRDTLEVYNIFIYIGIYLLIGKSCFIHFLFFSDTFHFPPSLFVVFVNLFHSILLEQFHNNCRLHGNFVVEIGTGSWCRLSSAIWCAIEVVVTIDNNWVNDEMTESLYDAHVLVTKRIHWLYIHWIVFVDNGGLI